MLRNPSNINLFKILSKKLFSENIKTVGIIGSGQMGTGIAYVFGRVSNHKILIFDNNKVQLEKANKFINSLLDKELTKGILKNEDKDIILKNFKYTSELNDFRETNFVVEAATEKLEVKQELFRNLDNITNKDVILATNTSSISITKIAASTKRPNKVIGMHFMNPVPVMKLVEIIKGLQTDEETFKTTTE
jgi:3-hydroxybutyryl-CoA dehydrogenase